MVFLDSIRARQIILAPETVQVLYQGSPVWIENVKSNNLAEVTRLDSTKDKVEVPVYMLVENSPVKQ
jgi:H-type small acid-soluble spore protein